MKPPRRFRIPWGTILGGLIVAAISGAITFTVGTTAALGDKYERTEATRVHEAHDERISEIEGALQSQSETLSAQSETLNRVDGRLEKLVDVLIEQ